MNQQVSLLTIGASSGGVAALMDLLRILPPPLPVPVVGILHRSENDESSWGAVFSQSTKHRVEEPFDKGWAQPGLVYLAPAGYQLFIETDGTFALSNDEPVLHCRPSIDVFFESAARAYGPHLIALVLTGANEDGAQGVRSVKIAGGRVGIQSLEEASVAVMPRAALAAVHADCVGSLAQLAAFVLENLHVHS